MQHENPADTKKAWSTPALTELRASLDTAASGGSAVDGVNGTGTPV